MNKEEFLKAIENVPKIDSINPISAYNSINVEDLANAVDRFKKIPTYDELLQENKKYKEVIFKIKMIISARIKEYQKKIDNEIDMGSQGDHFKICRYEENIKFLKDILKEVKTC